MAAAIAVGIVLAYASWSVLGPLLAGRPGVLQGTVGAMCGAVAAAPTVLLLSARTRRRVLVPTMCWLLAAAVLFLWAVPFRRGDIEGRAAFLADAGMYVPFSVLVFFALAVVLLRQVPDDGFRPMTQWLEGDPPARERTRRRGR
ncbi:hypothetical protein [Blastococcus saxobsidens]|nr:hypothetical protein [Blastococcus saxobsidens]